MHAIEDATMRRQPLLDTALHAERWRQGPALKRAQLYDPSMTTEDINQCRIENFDLEKRPRKFNSWVIIRPPEEYQAGPFFSLRDDLRRRG